MLALVNCAALCGLCASVPCAAAAIFCDDAPAGHCRSVVSPAPGGNLASATALDSHDVMQLLRRHHAAEEDADVEGQSSVVPAHWESITIRRDAILSSNCMPVHTTMRCSRFEGAMSPALHGARPEDASEVRERQPIFPACSQAGRCASIRQGHSLVRFRHAVLRCDAALEAADAVVPRNPVKVNFGVPLSVPTSSVRDLTVSTGAACCCR